MSTGQGKIFSSGDVIQDKWVILEFIDKGAFGEVYRAHQLNLQRDVAIKVVSQDWLNSTLEDDEEIDIALQRFRREVHAMAHIRHPNVLQVFDNGSMEINKNGNNKITFKEYYPLWMFTGYSTVIYYDDIQQIKFYYFSNIPLQLNFFFHKQSNLFEGKNPISIYNMQN